ncbi:MAG: ribbon-helix-helix protein, CopG family [Gemmatimonadaceae bacterium]
MAIPKIKATYSLDPETVRLLERVSRRWGVSKSEALRRAIRASASLPTEEGERLSALDRLQEAASLEPTTVAAWTRRVRSERRAGRAARARPPRRS